MKINSFIHETRLRNCDTGWVLRHISMQGWIQGGFQDPWNPPFERASVTRERREINVLMIKTKYRLQTYRGLDTGVPCADGSVQEPWQDLH